MSVATLTIAFWMTVVSTVVVTFLAVAVEQEAWQAPTAAVWSAVAYNAVAVFGYAQPAWLYLARSLPPVASTLSVMFIPVLGVVSGALWLNESLHWQDFAAMALMVASIASVLRCCTTRRRRARRDDGSSYARCQSTQSRFSSCAGGA